MQTRRLRNRKYFGTCSCAFTALFGSHPQWHQGPCSLLAHRKQHLASNHTESNSKQRILLSMLASVLLFNLVWFWATFRLSSLAWESWVQQRTLFSSLPLVLQPTFSIQIRVNLLDWLGWPAELKSMGFCQQRGGDCTQPEKKQHF